MSGSVLQVQGHMADGITGGQKQRIRAARPSQFGLDEGPVQTPAGWTLQLQSEACGPRGPPTELTERV